ncbi:hypothetical protein ACT29H_00805 [Thermophagus sp. OGC60D27]|uniref:hypothetical protein n=1 Tax=Thermophagus sp. OGC60D27 TaxID=3458415 RepID=UPI004037A4F9
MIVWSGRGILTALVFIVTLFLSIWYLPESLSDYGFATTCFISAAFSWIFGKKWNKQNKRIVTDNKTGQKLIIKRNHSLFWIPMQYWGIIFSIVGIIILYQNSIIASIVALAIWSVWVIIEIRNKSTDDLQQETPPNEV